MNFPIWKKIKIGTYISVEDLLKAAQDCCCVSGHAEKMFDEITIIKSETEIPLYVATVADLTGSNLATGGAVFRAIYSSGYRLCPAEIGPQLRLQYTDQPENEPLHIAMKPIGSSVPSVFGVVRNFVGHCLVDNHWALMYDVHGHIPVVFTK